MYVRMGTGGVTIRNSLLFRVGTNIVPTLLLGKESNRHHSRQTKLAAVFASPPW